MSALIMHPPRPKAIATFISSRDFLPGCQCLLHSINANLPPTAKDAYPPEVVVLLSSKLKDDASVTDRLRLFCTRIIEVEHIPINNGGSGGHEGENKPSHVKEWDENCGWTKLRLFELDGYDTILYIDADCLVVKDISHLLFIDEQEEVKRKGLVAAAPDIFPPDKFNAGVMVLRPSKDVFHDMMSHLPQSSSDDNTKCSSYDGGDTGFLNAYYPSWFASWPAYSRLSFGYNAQRLMHHYTYQNRPQYWDEGIDNLYIVHYSSSPKPWKAMLSESDESSKEYLDEQDKKKLKGGKLEHMWQAAYERSQKYFMKEKRKQLASSSQSSKQQQPPTAAKKPAKTSRSSPAQNETKSFNKRFKELRSSGMPMQEAMKKARAEFGLDKNDNVDPCQAVGQMFGLR